MFSNRRKRKATFTHPIDALRKGDAIFNQALGTVRQFQVLQQTLTENLPHHLGKHCHVIKIEEGALTLTVPSSALAAKLGQLAPTICELLKPHGYRVHKIKLKIVIPPREQGEIRKKTNAWPLKNQKAQCHHALRSLLKTSSNGALSDTIQKILDKP